MSLEPSDKSTEEKRPLTLFPKRRKGDSTNILADIDAQEKQFNDNYSPAEARENMRGLITAIIVGTYGACIAAVIAVGSYLIITQSTTLEQSTAALGSLGDFLSSHVVPIITLVLGFYFGSEKR